VVNGFLFFPIEFMKLKDLCSYLESAIPLSFQEDYDNSGLQVGTREAEISSAILTLDVTEEVLQEAIASGCDVVISHHPLIFKGIKSLTDRSFTERIISIAIRNDIAIYSAHTNLDNYSHGVSKKMAEKLNLEDVSVLSPSENKLLKFVTFIPESHFEKVSNAVFESGAGVIGNYDKCGFSLSGTGSFRGNENSAPFAGEKGKLHHEKEIRFETILYSHLKDKVTKALLESHPYEEVAYDFYALENINSGTGSGCVGKFHDPMPELEFLRLVSSVFDAKGLRYSKLTGKPVRKVALCGGSGAFLLGKAISSGADAYITSDIKYHDYFMTENKILLVDTGHFESEKFSREILKDLIIKKFPKFAVRFSETNTNPINYF
jgi:dinuclear metal center YbgI/SA1388 family protein